jgi:tetratricopeptide (TPR) repeat protein
VRKLLVFSIVILLVLAACQSETQDVEEVLESSRAHLEAGEYEKALTELEAAVEANPDSSDAHFLLGQTYNQTGEMLKAVDEFNEVLRIDPESAAAHHNLGVTYFQLQNPGAAVAEFQKALELDPDDPDTHYQLGATYLVLALPSNDPTAPPDPQFLEQATTEFETALKFRENMTEALIGLGNVYIQQRDYASAIETLQQVIEQAPNSLQAYYALGEACAQSGDAESACEAYDRFLELNPPTTWQSRAEEIMGALGCP